MLPLLPAILLLLLQGPSSIERLAMQGRLPSALNTVYRAVSETPTLRETERAVLATLLAAGEDPQLSDALLAILRRERGRRQTPPVVTREIRAAIPHLFEARTPSEGFARSQRTRDGPLSIA